jgi:GINS complex subunit 2
MADDGTLDMIGGEYGPFRPNMKAQVPLWMAMALHKRKRCSILPPAWMEPESLKHVFEDERQNRGVFQPLPFHYVEIATLLLRDAKDTFGESLYNVQTLVESIRKLRKTKIENGLSLLSGPMTVKMNNLSAMECNMIRPFFLGTLDRYYRHARMDEPPEVEQQPQAGPSGAAGVQQPQQEASVTDPSQLSEPRQLRRKQPRTV